MSSRLFRDSVPYRVDHIKSEISGIVFILPTLLILAFWHFRNFRIVSQSKRFGIFLHWIASVTVLLYGSIIPQRDQVVQRNQGETGSRSPLLSLGFKDFRHEGTAGLGRSSYRNRRYPWMYLWGVSNLCILNESAGVDSRQVSDKSNSATSLTQGLSTPLKLSKTR